MKKVDLFNIFSHVGLSILVSSILSCHSGYDHQKYWVPIDPPKAHYQIDGRIDLSDKVIEGFETITFTNNSSRNISVVAVDWSISDLSSIEVNVNGKPLPLLNTPDNPPISSPLLYALPKPVSSRSKVTLKIKFRLSASNLLGEDKEEIMLKNWYPRLWWDGLRTHDSFEAKLDIPNGYALAISGRLNKETGYYENNGVKTFRVYLGKGLETEERKVEDVLITALFTEKGSECARLCLETAVDVVKYYKNWLGFYPFKFLYIIPGGTDPWGGYPFASGIVVIHGQEKFETEPLLHWKWITAHEIGHQYWGEYVMDDDTPSWLWIGMGIYADREYTNFRNLGMEKHSGLMNRYLDGVLKYYDTTVDIPPAQREKILFDYNNIVTHGKGYSIISAIECILGKEAFENIYKRCLKDYGGKRLGYKEFWRVCEEESGEDLSWLFEQWVRSNKYLSYQIISQESIKEKDNYTSTVKVECTGSLKMPVPVKAVFEDGSNEIKYTNRLFNVNYLIFESKSKLKEVMLDPDNKLAMIKDSLFVPPEELSEIISQLPLPWTGAGEDALRYFERARESKLDNILSWFKLGLILFDGVYYEESFDAFQWINELNPPEIPHFAALVWMGHLKDLMDNREEALKYYKEALKYDTGDTIFHNQIGMKINRQWVEERIKTPFIRMKE